MISLRSASVLLAFKMLIAAGCAAQAAEWQTVQQLSPGNRIRVEAHSRADCVVTFVDESKLVCSNHRREETFARADIQRVSLLTAKQGRRWGKAIIAFLAIGGSGAAVSPEGGSAAMLGVAAATSTAILLWPRGSHAQPLYERPLPQQGGTPEAP